MPGNVETVRGPVAAGELGTTLMHEHLFIRNPELDAEYPDPHWREDELIAAGRTSLAALREKGIDTIVDLTVLGLGRYVPRIQRLLDGLEINVVVATGFYTMRDLPAFFHNHGPGRMIDAPDPLVGMFVRDLERGIGDSGVKAGVIKVVTDVHGITPDVERSLAAAAEAHALTGAPIITHSHPASGASGAQLAFLRSAGVDLERLVIGHCGDTTDLDLLQSLLDQGVTLGMDRFGAGMFLSDEDRIDTVAALCALGYADRLVLSHDASLYSVNSSPVWRTEHYPNWTHHFISDRVVPELLERGVAASEIHRMMVANPARILCR